MQDLLLSKEWVYKKKYPFQKIKENKREKHMSERFF